MGACGIKCIKMLKKKTNLKKLHRYLNLFTVKKAGLFHENI